MLKFTQASQEQYRPGGWVSPAKLKMVEGHVTAECDDTDGAHDGVVWDSRLCHYDVAKLRCKAGDGPDCLTGPEITSIQNLLRDTRMPITNMSNWSFLGPTPPPWSPEPTAANMPKTSGALVILTTWARTYLDQPDRDVVRQPLTAAELKQMEEAQVKIGFIHPTDPDLRALEKAGTKVFFWNGVSDPCCSNITLQEYWQDLVKARGGDSRKVQAFARYYQIPGMPHCGG
jgi:feruloyl esterase